MPAVVALTASPTPSSSAAHPRQQEAADCAARGLRVAVQRAERRSAPNVGYASAQRCLRHSNRSPYPSPTPPFQDRELAREVLARETKRGEGHAAAPVVVERFFTADAQAGAASIAQMRAAYHDSNAEHFRHLIREARKRYPRRLRRPKVLEGWQVLDCC